jgi:nucleotidyltransferase substrate binding protein (TIGR01987 family)
MLDISSLTKALATLEEAINAYQKTPENGFIRDACIQRFEYSYELSYKMLRRYLEMTESTTAIIDDLSFPSLIRLGFERGLLASEWVVWKSFREARNITAHTYDEKKAMDVFLILPSFLKEAYLLLNELQNRQEHVN